MNTQKLLIIGVVVLIIMFIAGVVLGQREHGTPAKVDTTSLAGSSLQSLISRPLDLNDLSLVSGSSTCLNAQTKEFVIASNQTCTFAIKASRLPTRKLGLHLVTPQSVTLSITLVQPQKKEAIDVHQTLPTEEPVSLSIFDAEGAMLTLTCNGSAECEVGITS